MKRLLLTVFLLLALFQSFKYINTNKKSIIIENKDLERIKTLKISVL